VISQTSPLVVGVDGSERSRDALALATRLADPCQQILLTHVHDYGRVSNLLSGRGYEQLVPDVANSTFAAVQDTLEPTTQRKLRLVSSSSPAAGLQATADETGASMIVVGSSHRSRIGRVLAGSVTERGFDGSPESRLALEWAAGLAHRRRAHLLAVTVHTPVAFGGVSTTGPIGYRAANVALRTGLHERLTEAIGALGDGRDASSRVVDGDAAVELAEASAELDLLVLGSRGYGPVRSVLLGSVSRSLVHSAACPVVVLPRGVHGAGEQGDR
jgi:nucleotide-binding universal stress UspA family protein